MRRSEEDRITRLEDVEEIRRLTIRYANAADRRNDPRVMRELFSEDAVWESKGFGVFRGRAQILAGLREIAATRVSHTLHYMIAPLVDVASDRRSARASWRLWELAHLKKRNRFQVQSGYGWGRLHLQAGTNGWQVALSTSVIEDQHSGAVPSGFSDRHARKIAA